MRIARTALAAAIGAAFCSAQARTELRFAIQADPKTFDPLLAAEEPSQTVAYLTGGVLIRLNRITQRLEPELAVAWNVLDGGRRIDFTLRRNVHFSDGAPFDSDDVVSTVRRMMDPNLHSAISDTFRPGGITISATANGPDRVSVFLAAPIARLETLFDQLIICSSRSRRPDMPVLGPFLVDGYRSGQYVLLRRNPYYWKVDAAGKKLPYFTAVRLLIQSNRDIELFRFRRGDSDWVDKMQPDSFERLRKDSPSSAVDAGASLDPEFLWFNQASAAPLPAYKRRWFTSQNFRRAISCAINRDDLVRLVYLGHAHVAFGPVSTANRLWFNSRLPAPVYDPKKALSLLEKEGFRFAESVLRDHEGNRVEFSLITNAGSKTRVPMGEMIQQDLGEIGIRLNFTPIEFQSLIERITRTQNYESCLLGLANMDIDPNSQTNVWLSSGTHHAWNPSQSKPATAWEAEIDRLIQKQASAGTVQERKQVFDRLQEIVRDQSPIIYLVNPNVLLGVSNALRGIAVSPIPPHLFWNVEYITIATRPEPSGH